jgi:hypothetical protein
MHPAAMAPASQIGTQAQRVVMTTLSLARRPYGSRIAEN